MIRAKFKSSSKFGAVCGVNVAKIKEIKIQYKVILFIIKSSNHSLLMNLKAHCHRYDWLEFRTQYQTNDPSFEKLPSLCSKNMLYIVITNSLRPCLHDVGSMLV